MAVHMGLDRSGNIINSGTGRSYASEFSSPERWTEFLGIRAPKCLQDLVSAAELGAEEVVPCRYLEQLRQHIKWPFVRIH